MLKSLSNSAASVRPVNPLSSGTGKAWQTELREAVRDSSELLRMLGHSPPTAAEAVTAGFPVLAPRPFIARMRYGDPRDPLLLQVLSRPEELTESPGFVRDAVGDLDSVAAPGLLKKYRGRALLIASKACAVNCRYCFRRHFPYETAPSGTTAWEPAVRSIAADTTTTEVILSGGDPLMLVDSALASLVERLSEIPHVRRLRFHTRLPVVIPSRVTPELLDIIRGTRLTPVVVLHINHPNEIDPSVAAIAERFVSSGATLFNQSVLLRGVNDSASVLGELSERLIEARISPYYLHQLDRVQGTSHFEVPVEDGKQLIAELRQRLPGYLVPKYVSEDAGDLHKTPLA